MIDKCDCFKNCITPAHSQPDAPSAKRKRVEPSSLSEQEQIALAIGNSLRDMDTDDDDNHDDDSLDNVDEDSDYEDFDDESSSQSFAKAPSSQATSEHSNSNIGGAKSEIVECDTNNIGSTTDIADSYENYLGDETGVCSFNSIHSFSRIILIISDSASISSTPTSRSKSTNTATASEW